MKKIILLLTFLLLMSHMTYPVNAENMGNTALQLPDIKSETAILMDADTGQVLYQKEIDKRMYPASITKIMTGLLALKNGEFSDLITISEDSLSAVESDSANIALFSDEQITLEQALYALSVASANDAANVIAESISGTIDYFVGRMNLAAEEAGATNTHFTNPSGMPDVNHYTTARDMALITAQALHIPNFTEIFSTKRYTIPPTNKQPETRIFNSSNRFLNGDMTYEGILMSKAGWTEDAQHTLVTAARRNGTTLIAVVMKSSDSKVKWSDTVALLDFGFEQFETVTIPKKDILQAVPNDMTLGVEAATIDLNTCVAQDVSILLPIGASSEDIQITFQNETVDDSSKQVQINMCLRLPTVDNPYLSTELLDTTVQVSLQPFSEEADINTNSTKSVTKIDIFKIILITFISVLSILILTFISLLMRRVIIIRKKRRKRQRGISGRHKKL